MEDANGFDAPLPRLTARAQAVGHDIYASPRARALRSRHRRRPFRRRSGMEIALIAVGAAIRSQFDAAVAQHAGKDARFRSPRPRSTPETCPLAWTSRQDRCREFPQSSNHPATRP